MDGGDRWKRKRERRRRAKGLGEINGERPGRRADWAIARDPPSEPIRDRVPGAGVSGRLCGVRPIRGCSWLGSVTSHWPVYISYSSIPTLLPSYVYCYV